MKVVARTIANAIATVYVAENNGDIIEFVESVQPPLSVFDKWVLIVSTMVGCPVKCLMCDAGWVYKRKLSKDEIFFQIDYMTKKRFAISDMPIAKLKIQFARVGEPTLNHAVLAVLEELPYIYTGCNLMPAISTVAPCGSELFLEKLLDIKNRLYANGKFQLQFSIHSTDFAVRDKIIPIKKWDFAKIANYGETFYANNDRKITLNFALATTSPLEVAVLTKYFDPKKFLLKITPVNPTISAVENNFISCVNNGSTTTLQKLMTDIELAGYELIVSVGELEENSIGSNCGQYLRKFLHSDVKMKNSYQQELEYL